MKQDRLHWKAHYRADETKSIILELKKEKKKKKKKEKKKRKEKKKKKEVKTKTKVAAGVLKQDTNT